MAFRRYKVNQLCGNYKNKYIEKIFEKVYSCTLFRAYDGRFLAIQEKIIIVSINYRLNSFGFLITQDGKETSNWNIGKQKPKF